MQESEAFRRRNRIFTPVISIQLENKSAILLSGQHDVRSTERVGDSKKPRDESTSHGSEISPVELGASQADEEVLV